MNKEVNYKNKKTYNTAKLPIRQPIFIVWLIWLLSRIMLIGKKYKVEKINMEGLKPPYFMLSNHMYFIDFELAAMGTLPHRVNNVVSIDGYYRRPWLMELIGAICTRKYTRDMHLIKSINRVIKRGDILSMYPEARYSPCGITSYIPDALGKLIKLNKAPVVAVVHHGNYLHSPFWNFRKKRKVPFHTTMTQILTAEQVKAMSADEINEVVKKALEYDDYRYQKENMHSCHRRNQSFFWGWQRYKNQQQMILRPNLPHQKICILQENSLLPQAIHHKFETDKQLDF